MGAQHGPRGLSKLSVTPMWEHDNPRMRAAALTGFLEKRSMTYLDAKAISSRYMVTLGETNSLEAKTTSAR